MRLIDEVEFRRFYDLAMSIAEESDVLIAEQKEVADFAISLREFLYEVGRMIASGEVDDSTCLVRMPVDRYSWLASRLTDMQAAVGADAADCNRLGSVDSLPLLRRRVR